MERSWPSLDFVYSSNMQKSNDKKINQEKNPLKDHLIEFCLVTWHDRNLSGCTAEIFLATEGLSYMAHCPSVSRSLRLLPSGCAGSALHMFALMKGDES